jgi:hypothetical protein
MLIEIYPLPPPPYYDGGRPQNSVKACDRPQISVISLWHAADHPKKPVCTVFISLFYGGADRRRKIGGHTVPVACRRPNFLSRQGTFPEPVACRRTNFSTVRGRGCL